jgi:phosphoadenosine phosphosulfate reductase
VIPERAFFTSPEEHYADLERGDPQTILRWTANTIDRLAIATSFQSSGLVILHMMRQIREGLPVLFIDTGFHFPETLSFKDEIVKLWGLNLVELRGEHGSAERQAEIYGPKLYERDPDRCCQINKVEPLQPALEGYDGWISGLRRDQSPLRAQTPILEAQMLRSGSEILKVHPLARWTKEQVAAYVREHDIPTHPLLEKGFASIGCWPCTRAVRNGEAERDGRWDGLGKTECGIHTFGKQTEADQ